MAHNLQSLVAASVLLAVLVLLAPANAQDKRGPTLNPRQLQRYIGCARQGASGPREGQKSTSRQSNFAN